MSKYYNLVVKTFGRKPEITVFGPTQYRVGIPNYNVHNGATTSHPHGDGRSLELACKAMLDYVALPASWCHEGPCHYECHTEYSRMKDKQKAASKNLWSVIEQASKTVDSWPAWKRGLPPCENPDCEREYEHEGKHRRAKPVEFDEWE